MFVMFNSERTAHPNGRKTHLSNANISDCKKYCKKCIVDEKERINAEAFLGCLSLVDAIDYNEMCDVEAAASVLRRDGICVMSLTVAENTAIKALTTRLCDELQKISFDKLKHGHNKNHILTSNHPERKWKRIMPKEGAVTMNKREKFIECEVNKFLIPLLSKRICPHELYAHTALMTLVKLRKGKKEVSEGGFNEKHVPAPLLLTLEHINGLIRGPGLDEDQILHIDGKELKIIVIIVIKCNESGYELCCVKGSHNHFSNHNVNIGVPKEMVKRVHAKEGQLICFAESLIHGGGKSSGKRSEKDENEAKGNNHRLFTFNSSSVTKKKNFFTGKIQDRSPTDISFQLTFHVATAKSTSNVGSGKIISFSIIEEEEEGETKAEDISRKRQEYHDHMKTMQRDEFERRLDRGFSKWCCNLLNTKHDDVVRRRP